MTNDAERGQIRTIIVGAGQAGLAVANELIRRGLKPQHDFEIIDAGTVETLAWRGRWRSLTLFTPSGFSSLRALPLDNNPARYPAGRDIADYLDTVRERLQVVPRWSTTALSVQSAPHEHGLVLSTNRGDYWAQNVVAASGPFHSPRMPPFADELQVPGESLHSHDYIGSDQLPEGRVLVVGAGNTGIQIARELSSAHDVTIATGRPLRRLPQRVLGVDVFTWLRATGVLGIPASSLLGRRLARRELVIGEGLDELRGRGIATLPRVVGVERGEVIHEGGGRTRPTSVVWATGYRSGVEWLPSQVRTTTNPSGLVHKNGRTPLKGLFVVGAPWLRNRASALIGGVSADAARVARAIGGAR